MKSNRRTFLQCATGTALATFVQNSAFAKETPAVQPIIDTHQHLWDLSKFQPPWLSGAPEVIAKTHVTEDFKKSTAGLNVVKAVYMEVNVDPKDQVREAKHVIELSKSDEHPTVGAVISGRPNSEKFKEYFTQFKDSPHIKGLRQVLHPDSAPQGLCLQPQFVKSAQWLGEVGMCMDLCMRPTELGDGAKLAKQCPQTRFVVDHCGNADPKAFLPDSKLDGEETWHSVDAWKSGIGELAKLENVVCKISGIIARVPKTGWSSETLAPIVNHCLEVFGPDRVMFGGDWPVCKVGGTYAQWVNALKEIVAERPQIEQQKLFHDNAEQFYKIA